MRLERLGLIKAINSLKQNKSTVIIITHRTKYLQVTNKLAVIKNGLLECMVTQCCLVKLKPKCNSIEPIDLQPNPNPNLSKPKMRRKVTLGKPTQG